MKYLCLDCKLTGPWDAWPCDVAYHRDVLSSMRSWPRHLVETDWLSRASA